MLPLNNGILNTVGAVQIHNHIIWFTFFDWRICKPHKTLNLLPQSHVVAKSSSRSFSLKSIWWVIYSPSQPQSTRGHSVSVVLFMIWCSFLSFQDVTPTLLRVTSSFRRVILLSRVLTFKFYHTVPESTCNTLSLSATNQEGCHSFGG